MNMLYNNRYRKLARSLRATVAVSTGWTKDSTAGRVWVSLQPARAIGVGHGQRETRTTLGVG